MRFRYHDALVPLLVPVEAISQHPENPNNGDLDKITESIQTNGFTVPIVVQASTQFIIAGNHRYQAAIGLGATHIPVIWVDMDDTQALRYMLADNRTARLGQDDLAILDNLLGRLELTEVGIVGTGYTDDDLAVLRSAIEGPLEFNEDEYARQKSAREIMCPSCGHTFGGGR